MGAKKTNKRVATKQLPANQRSARTAAGLDPDSWRDDFPAWRFHMLDTGGPYCWTAITAEKAVSLQKRLAEFEKLRWREVLNQKSNHDWDIGELSRDAQRRLADEFPQIETLYQLRIQKRQRVYGYRIGNVLHLLWWDEKHRVYPMER